jgi:hypothetical protein
MALAVRGDGEDGRELRGAGSEAAVSHGGLPAWSAAGEARRRPARLRPTNSTVGSWIEEANATSSRPYMSSAKVGGIYMLRRAVGSMLTERHTSPKHGELCRIELLSCLVK